jgi:hypothetical protein
MLGFAAEAAETPVRTSEADSAIAKIDFFIFYSLV